MRIHVEHHHHYDPQVEARLRSVDRKLDLIIQNQENIMASVKENLDVAEKAAHDNADAEDAIIVILDALKVEVAALKEAGTDPATASRIEALASALTARTPKLAAAAVAGTPSA